MSTFNLFIFIFSLIMIILLSLAAFLYFFHGRKLSITEKRLVLAAILIAIAMIVFYAKNSFKKLKSMSNNETTNIYKKGDSVIINETIYRDGKFFNDTTYTIIK